MFRPANANKATLLPPNEPSSVQPTSSFDEVRESGRQAAGGSCRVYPPLCSMLAPITTAAALDQGVWWRRIRWRRTALDWGPSHQCKPPFYVA